MSILFRCDASPQIGLGHLVRCLALADEFDTHHEREVSFAMRSDDASLELVRQRGFQVLSPPTDRPSFDYAAWLQSAAASARAEVVVLDVRDELPVAALRKLRVSDVLLVTLDDASPRRLEVDLAFYPPSPQVRQFDWIGFQGEWRCGWEWVVLRRQFSQRPTKPKRIRPEILITMGGADPKGVTLRVVKAIDRLEREFDMAVVVGSAFQRSEELKTALFSLRHHVQLHRNVDFMAALMGEADMAVAMFGVTAYELAAMGTPALYLCPTADHMESSKPFIEAGMAQTLGLISEISEVELATAVCALLDDVPRRKKMAESAGHLIDGLGVQRIAELILHKLKDKRRYIG